MNDGDPFGLSRDEISAEPTIKRARRESTVRCSRCKRDVSGEGDAEHEVQADAMYGGSVDLWVSACRVAMSPMENS